MLGEDDAVGERPREAGAVVAGDVVLGERARAAGADVVLRVLLHLVQREDAEPRLLEHGLVDVGRVDPDAVARALPRRAGSPASRPPRRSSSPRPRAARTDTCAAAAPPSRGTRGRSVGSRNIAVTLTTGRAAAAPSPPGRAGAGPAAPRSSRPSRRPSAGAARRRSEAGAYCGSRSRSGGRSPRAGARSRSRSSSSSSPLLYW